MQFFKNIQAVLLLEMSMPVIIDIVENNLKDLHFQIIQGYRAYLLGKTFYAAVLLVSLLNYR